MQTQIKEAKAVCHGVHMIGVRMEGLLPRQSWQFGRDLPH